MALCEKVLRKKAKKLELKGLQKKKLIPERISALDELLHDVYAIRRPKSSDYFYRRDLVRIFNEIAKEIYGKSGDLPVVEEFGSFLMDIFSANSDLDLSVNFRQKAVEFPREKKIQTLRKFAKKLYPLQRKGHVSSVHPITTAKIVRMISSIDERFPKLSFLMKAWAKANDINSSKDRTLNSLSIISLVALHLQTRDPPIFPPLSAIFRDGTDPPTVSKVVNGFLNYGQKNKESLAELFITLLIKLASVETLWPEGLCASTYEGSWTSKTWNSKVGYISVEDFTDRSQNVARAVGKTEVKNIYNCIHLSVQYVLSFMDGQIQGPQLKEFLFGSDPVPTLVGNGTTNLDKNVVQPEVACDPIQTKKMRFTEGWGGIKQAVPLDPIHMKRMQSVEGWGGPNTRGWGGIHTEGWGGARIASWEGTHTKVWGGTQTEGWGGTQQFAPLDPIQGKNDAVYSRLGRNTANYSS
ncbi:hypothetical protein F0562_005814 [Nyssa sinensis]|uniref:Poly(A) RNA polymerase mitochondrial-like central palm domain-containing protein n=1 Tax=Nyssa sinensis TaxID=561372 RepID=A0A5J5AJ89_9ASTE|nr:hypothetical protein F0562_005814 [Nyssa sinensis]